MLHYPATQTAHRITDKLENTEDATSSTLVYASLGRRIGAFWIDFFICLFSVFLLASIAAFIIAAIAILAGVPKATAIVLMTISGYVIDILGRWLYFSLQESSSKQATLGKRVVRIKISDIKGQRISFLQASARYFAKILTIATLFFGFLLAAFLPKRQALHDLITGCLVLKK